MNLKKICAGVMSALVLGTYAAPVWAADPGDVVKTVSRTEKKVSVECPEVVGGSKKATEKINSTLSREVASLVSEASTLGGGSVHYDVHKADDDMISLTLVMTPNMGVEETQGMTFNRKTGELKPLSDYYSGGTLAARAKDGLSYLYDVPEDKQNALPDTYYVDTDGSVIGLYHAGAVLDKNEGEIEINLSASGLDDGVTAGPAEENKNTDQTAAAVKQAETRKAEPAVKKDGSTAKKAAADQAKADKEKAETAKVKAAADKVKKEEAEKAAAEKKARQEKAAVAAKKAKTEQKTAAVKTEKTASAPQAVKQKAETAAGTAAAGTAAVKTQSVKEKVAAIQKEKAAQDKAEGEARLKQLEANQVEQTKKREAEEAARRAEEERQAELAQQQEAQRQAAASRSESTDGVTSGTITGTEVRMRAAAGLDGEVIGVFNQGEKVDVLYGRNASGMKWYEVRRSDGTTGWVASAYCALGSAGSSYSATTGQLGTITGTEVRMRAAAGLDGEVIGAFEQGETVVLISEATASGMNWRKVRRSDGTEGWVAAEYCRVNG